MSIVSWIKDKFLITNLYYFVCSRQKNESSIQEYVLDKMTVDDLNQMKAVYPKEVDDEKYNILLAELSDEKFKDISVYVLKYRDTNEIQGYCATSSQCVYENGNKTYIRVKKNTLYLYDDYIFQDYRGNSLQREMINKRIAIAKNEKYEKVFSCVYLDNLVSARNYLNLGFRKEKSIIFIRKLNLHIIWPIIYQFSTIEKAKEHL